MADRLRQLLDLVVTADPGVDGVALAGQAHFSRDHLDRIVAAATGETPAVLRRRLLLERAAWELGRGASATDAATGAGYGSVAAFSRAFARVHGCAPTRHVGPFTAPAPNGIHFHPPGGLRLPGPRRDAGPDLAVRMLEHHLDRVRELLRVAATVAPEALERAVRPGLVVVWFEGEEASAGELARRLVAAVEVWAAAIGGEPLPPREGPLGPRLERSGAALLRQTREIAARGGWDDAFVDALCEPPQTFGLGAVLAHVLGFGAARREALAGVLRELGADPGDGDPILWDLRRRGAR